MMGTYALLAEALRYPAPGRIEILQAGAIEMSEGNLKKSFSAFIAGVQGLSLGEWEELHTRTLDLNPPAAPYLGYQMWGDSYQRGNFMASLNHAFQAEEIDQDGELPDHLIPILRYLDSVSSPLPELVEVLESAVERMLAGLRKADTSNPYTHLLQTILSSFSNGHLSPSVKQETMDPQAF
jgi:nitrate reductase delta subunit